MNLLLLLSALMSALTGVTGGARAVAPAEQVAVARVAVAAVQQAVAPHAAVSAGQWPAQRATRLAIAPLIRLSLAAPALYASRRRE